MGELIDRRELSKKRIKELRDLLKEAEQLAGSKACVYATGSLGRFEASSHSDLDLFIVGKSTGRKGADGREGSQLNRLDEICIKADLIEAARKLSLPEFSGEGRYLIHYSIDDLIKTLGKPEDDVTNTFTARLLLLLESYPLLGREVYDDILREVIAPYWRDYEDHKNNFVPAFLANDILRLWRTFCVNYEAGTERIPEDKKAKGKLKNYKLKHSRMLTCYSALLYLLATFARHQTVSPADVLEMIHQTPTGRLEWLIKQQDLQGARPTIEALLGQYEKFLETTNAPEADLLLKFEDKDASREFMEASYKFGDLMFEALNCLGGSNRFHRLLVV
ncbi:MAG: nucleotidyltransferase domain-containing protein [Pseudorhodoplanes sp.]|nr:nucleotidyltransferase domain-containing protein [Pseudorhodoplanes sp.]